MYVDRAPPVRVVAVITLLASTLDLFADMLLCHRLNQTLDNFCTRIAWNAAICYFVFTGISVIVYACEMIDVCLTLKVSKGLNLADKAPRKNLEFPYQIRPPLQVPKKDV